MRRNSHSTLVLFVLYLVFLVLVGTKIADLGGEIQKTNFRLETLMEKVVDGGPCVLNGENNRVTDEACVRLQQCEVFVRQVTDEVLAKEYCLRKEVTK